MMIMIIEDDGNTYAHTHIQKHTNLHDSDFCSFFLFPSCFVHKFEHEPNLIVVVVVVEHTMNKERKRGRGRSAGWNFRIYNWIIFFSGFVGEECICEFELKYFFFFFFHWYLLEHYISYVHLWMLLLSENSINSIVIGSGRVLEARSKPIMIFFSKDISVVICYNIEYIGRRSRFVFVRYI